MIIQVVHAVIKTVAGFENPELIGSGIALTFSGLAIWLAGLGMGRIAAAVTGGLLGFICGYAFLGQTGFMLILCASAGLVVLLIIEQTLVTIAGYNSFINNLLGSVFYSCCGTAFIFTGIIILLLYKGTDSAAHIAARQSFYTILLFAMAVFGAVEQLVLCPKAKQEPVIIKPEPVQYQEQPAERLSWRNR